MGMMGNMERTVGALRIRRQFGKTIRDVLARDSRFVVERHSEPVTALVPMKVCEQWQRGREAIFDQLDPISPRADLSPEAAEQLAEQAVRQARTESSLAMRVMLDKNTIVRWD